MSRVGLFALIVICIAGEQAYGFGEILDSDEECCDKVEDLEERVEYLESKAVQSDSKKIVLSGHVNRAALWLDNGKNSNTAHVDNDNSESRLNVTGTANFNEDLLVGGTFELGIESNTSGINDVHDAQTNFEASNEIHIRKAELFFSSYTYGKLALGRGHMASNGTMEATDLSYTRATANGAGGAAKLAGGAKFHNKTTDRRTTNTLGEIFDPGDGFAGDGRHDRIRYDTPSFYGFSAATSHGYQNTGDLWDVAAKFAGKFMGIKVAAQIAYVKDNSDDVSARILPGNNYQYKQYNGSLGILFPLSFSGKRDTGINLFFGAAHRDWDLQSQKSGQVYVGKVGYTDQYFKWGRTSMAVDFGSFNNMIIDDEKASVARQGGDASLIQNEPRGKSWGVFVVQNLDNVATELYAGYRKYDFKLKGSDESHDNIHAVVAGARLKL